MVIGEYSIKISFALVILFFFFPTSAIGVSFNESQFHEKMHCILWEYCGVGVVLGFLWQ